MNKSRIAGLDLLRAVAILAVLGLHAGDCFRSGLPATLARPLAFGWTGVE